ncbi:MAG: rhomboid family intrarane serine protease [Acidobacteriaceae bacterium]|jgi:membrane associated rhomboid family serine protease|nr:rhomboid family intrarane serine protease [Acidobacteriaceae bacterium]
MPGSRPLTLSFPPFAGMTKNLILVNLAVFAASLLSHLVHPLAVIPALLMLTPNAVVHALFVWQPLTFGFVPDLSLLSVLFSMLSLWFMGFYLEDLRGSRFLLETYLISTLLGGVLATGLSFTGFLHMSPGSTITGANAALFGLLACFAVLYGDQQFYMLPLPFGIKAKYLAIILMLIAFVMLIGGGNALAEVAYLGGGLGGYLYAKFAPRRGYGFAASESFYSVRNGYYRWKRARAARKFQVYMGKQGREVHFDKEGRYVDPDDRRRMH